MSSARFYLVAVGIFFSGWFASYWYYGRLPKNPAPSLAPSAAPATAAAQAVPAEKQIVIAKEKPPVRLSVEPQHIANANSGQSSPDFRSLDDIWLSDDSDAWNTAVEKILTKAREAMAKGKLKSASALLQEILRLEHTNIEAIKLSGEIHRRQGNSLMALEAIYRARRMAVGGEQEKALIKESRQWVAELASPLSMSHDDIGLLNLFQKAVELEPDYARHYLDLAKAYLALGNKNDAWNTLELARFDSSIGVEIDNMEQSIKNEKPLDFSSATAIPLSRYGKQFYIPVVIDNSYQANWLLDTGASMSVISPDALSSVSVDPNSFAESWFNTANGVVKGNTVMLNNLTVGGSLQLNSLKVGVLPLGANGRFDGLLGMDFLRLFDFYLDQQANVLYLK